MLLRNYFRAPLADRLSYDDFHGTDLGAPRCPAGAKSRMMASENPLSGSAGSNER